MLAARMARRLCPTNRHNRPPVFRCALLFDAIVDCRNYPGNWACLRAASNFSRWHNMRRIAVFIGTRPEAIKMAPVIAALKRSKVFEPVVVNTGQHRELIEQVIDLFEIEIDRDLAVMEPNQSLAPLLARLLTRIDATLADLQPDMVLAQGDTSTVLATAL